MQKIPTLFVRSAATNLVTKHVTVGCEWVINGEGRATRKFNGTCCLVRDGRFYKRYEVPKNGTPPKDFEAATEVDPNTGKQQGWLPVSASPGDKYHREAWLTMCELVDNNGMPTVPDDGTYELCGPKVQGNPEKLITHLLIRHGEFELDANPRNYVDIKEYLRNAFIEGIVWHHEDGRMVKIKRKDFFRTADDDIKEGLVKSSTSAEDMIEQLKQAY